MRGLAIKYQVKTYIEQCQQKDKTQIRNAQVFYISCYSGGKMKFNSSPINLTLQNYKATKHNLILAH